MKARLNDCRRAFALSGSAFRDDPIEEVMTVMAESQIRRMPVIDHDRRLVGIVSLGDLATRNEDDEVSVEDTLAEISAPSRPDR